MKKYLRPLFQTSLCLMLFLVLAVFTVGEASAAEKISAETGNILLTTQTGIPSGEADTRLIRLMNIPVDFDARYTARWMSADETVAEVSPEGLVRAVAPGETMIRCEISRVSTGKLCATVAVTVTVQESGGGIAITGIPEGNMMSAGDSYAFHRNMDQRLGVDPTCRTVWEVSNPAVASVDVNGVVTALSEGEFTLWARALTPDGETVAVSEGVTVTVAAGFSGIKQLTANTVEITFSPDLEQMPDASDYAVKEADGTLLGISKVTSDAAKKTAVIETFAPFRDGETYTVSVDGLGSMRFTASHGEIATVEVVARNVEAGKATKMEYILRDAGGAQRYKGSETENVFTEGDRVELLSSDDDAWIDGMELTIYDTDATAAVTVRYYPTGEGTYVESLPVIIRAVEDDTEIVSVDASCVSNSTDGSSIDWSAAGSVVHVGDRGWYLHLRSTDRDDNRIYTDAAGDDGWYFTSENPEIVGIDSDTGHLTPFREGTASIYCLHNEYSTTVNVTVRAARTAAGITATADKTVLTPGTTASVTISVTDASGTQVAKKAADLTWSFVSGSEPHPVVAVTDTEGGVFMTVTAAGDTASGQHTLQISCGSAKTEVTFTVSAESEAETTDVTGGVIWYAADSARPASVTLTLYADGVSQASANVTAADGWQHTWTGLPVSQNGSTVNYTVKAAAPAGFFVTSEDSVTTAVYTAEITGAAVQTDGSGNAVITVTFSGSLADAESAGITVSGGTVQSVTLSGNTLVLNMGALSHGTHTVSGSGIYGAASVNYAAG